MSADLATFMIQLIPAAFAILFWIVVGGAVIIAFVKLFSKVRTMQKEIDDLKNQISKR